jgi:hypothetical protein
MSASSLEKSEKRRKGIKRLNLFLLWLLPLVVVATVADGAWWITQRQPVLSVAPNLTAILEPLPEIPSLTFPTALLKVPEPDPVPAEQAQKPEVVIRQINWRLKGILAAGGFRAFLEDPETQEKYWVRVGDKLGEDEVQSIGERSVILIRGGQPHEIRI